MVGVQVFIFHGVVADLLDIVGNDDPVDHELLARGRIVGLICVPAGRLERRKLLLGYADGRLAGFVGEHLEGSIKQPPICLQRFWWMERASI